MTPDPLAQAVRRWRRSNPQTVREPSTGSGQTVYELAQRLDDKGCAYGRVTSARLDELARAAERLEMKLNAVLLAVTSTFISSLVGLLIFYLRN